MYLLLLFPFVQNVQTLTRTTKQQQKNSVINKAKCKKEPSTVVDHRGQGLSSRTTTLYREMLVITAGGKKLVVQCL